MKHDVPCPPHAVNETLRQPPNGLNVLLLGQKGLDGKHLDETARWFERHPGPVVVRVEKRPVELPLDEDGVMSWDSTFRVLSELRRDHELGSDDFIILLVHSPNERNWFAAQDPENMRSGFGHVDDFSWATSAPASVISAHYILKGIFNALVTDAGLDWTDLWHEEPRGCLFDFCARKTDLNFKLRTADICGDCMEVFRDIGVPDGLLRQTVEIMEACRPHALNTRQYLQVDQQFGRWPFPVAVTRHKIVQATNPLLKFLLLLDHFDSLIRYFFLAREVIEGRTPKIEERPALGWWVDQLAHSLKGQGNFRQVVSIAQRENVVALRNERRGHGYMAADPQTYEHEAAALEEVIGRIEDELTPFFEQHRLLIPRRIEPRDGVYIAEGEELKGSHLLHPAFKASLPSDPLSAGLTSLNEVFVSDSKLQRFHRLSPYIRSTVCPTCHHPRILVTDGGSRYIDVFMGHRVDIP